MSDRKRGIVVAGCEPDTGNLGVSALFEATVVQLGARLPGVPITVLDYGRGAREHVLPTRPDPLRYERVGAALTKRLHRANSWFQITLSARLGGLANVAARRFRDALAVVDISGGDSFTDLYGRWRFESVMRPKSLALELGVPLVLLPQTYGPFQDPDMRARAARTARRAAAAWARDERSFEVLRELLGDDFDPARHVRGVDVAFLLEPRPARERVPAPIAAWLEDPAVEVFGVNVSGLIHNDPGKARTRYGFVADYAAVVQGLVREMLRSERARVVLIPHVVTPPGHYESDVAACEAVRGAVGDERVSVLPDDFDQAEIKEIIGSTSWFCGTRMHSTIAALSSGVPCAAIAYSPKTKGVFETCGQAHHVADPREEGTADVLAALIASWEAREEARASLAARLPEVVAQAEAQMDHVARLCHPAERTLQT